MTDENKEKDKEAWAKKKEPIIENIDETIALKEQALKNTNQAKNDVSKSVGQIKNDLTRLCQIRDVFKSSAYLPMNIVTGSSLAGLYSLSVIEKESAKNVLFVAEKLKNESTIFAGTVSTSTAALTNMTSSAIYLAKSMIDTEPVSYVISKMDEPTSNDRKNQLSPMLKKIEARLATKLEGAWYTLNDTANEDRFSQAANSARELISDLLITMAPDDKVQSTRWFKSESENGKPTQRQRAKYVILGSNESLTDDILKPIDELSQNVRDSYEKLNPIAHQRDYTKSLQALSESIIDSVQIYLLELLKLRGIYFKEP